MSSVAKMPLPWIGDRRASTFFGFLVFLDIRESGHGGWPGIVYNPGQGCEHRINRHPAAAPRLRQASQRHAPVQNTARARPNTVQNTVPTARAIRHSRNSPPPATKAWIRVRWSRPAWALVFMVFLLVMAGRLYGFHSAGRPPRAAVRAIRDRR